MLGGPEPKGLAEAPGRTELPLTSWEKAASGMGQESGAEVQFRAW